MEGFLKMEYDRNYDLQHDLKYIFRNFLQQQSEYFEQTDEYSDTLSLFAVYLFKHDQSYSDFRRIKNFTMMKLLFTIISARAIKCDCDCDYDYFEHIITAISENKFEIQDQLKGSRNDVQLRMKEVNSNDLVIHYTKPNVLSSVLNTDLLIIFKDFFTGAGSPNCETNRMYTLAIA